MYKPIFQKPLKTLSKGKKVYDLSIKDVDEILHLRGVRAELDPGMGGVSPKVLSDLLETSSELVSVDFAMTSACNFKCAHCYRPNEEWNKLFIDFETISKVVEQSLELGVRFFVLTGGEPLMYKSRDKEGNMHDYFDIVDKILETYDKAGTEVKVLTFSDVALITKEKAKKLAERKVGLCLKRDTLDHKVQDDILCVKGGSKKMEEGYNNLFEVGYGTKPELAVSVNSVLREGEMNTLKGAVELHRWVRYHGMEHSIVPIHYCGEAIEEEQESGINALQVKALYDIIAEIDRIEFNDAWTVYSAFPKNKTCNRPGRGVHIRATGKVTACSESPLIEPYIFGDIKKENFTDIIRSKKFQEFKEEFAQREGKFICNPEVCDLNKNYLCRGGCATRSAYSKVDENSGLIVKNEDMESYSKGHEDPLCPAWVVLAQKQGALKERLYEETVDIILQDSNLELELVKKIKYNIIQNFEKLKNTI